MSNVAAPQLKSEVAMERILDWIRSGAVQPGDRLQSERELARVLEMNPRTVRRGLAELVKQGVVEKRPRAGNFIRGARFSGTLANVAMVFPDYLRDKDGSHPHVGSTLAGVSNVLKQHDFAVSTYWYGSGRFWVDAGQLLVGAGVKGILLYPHSTLVRSDIERLQEKGIKVALLSRPSCAFLHEMCIGGVQFDAVAALEQILDRLLAAGHRRIAVGLYTANPERERAVELLKRYQREVPDLGQMRDLLFDVPNEVSTDYRVLPLVLQRQPRPTAIVMEDEVGIGELFRLCYREGLRVPSDLSVACIYNSASHAFPVRVVSLDTPRMAVEAGVLASEYLKRMLEGQPVDHGSINVPFRIQDGDSIGPATQNGAGRSWDRPGERKEDHAR